MLKWPVFAASLDSSIAQGCLVTIFTSICQIQATRPLDGSSQSVGTTLGATTKDERFLEGFTTSLRNIFCEVQYAIRLLQSTNLGMDIYRNQKIWQCVVYVSSCISQKQHGIASQIDGYSP